MKKYIRSDTYYVNDGYRYQPCIIADRWCMYDSDSGNYDIIKDIPADNLNDASDLCVQYSQDHLRDHILTS